MIIHKGLRISNKFCVLHTGSKTGGRKTFRAYAPGEQFSLVGIDTDVWVLCLVPGLFYKYMIDSCYKVLSEDQQTLHVQQIGSSLGNMDIATVNALCYEDFVNMFGNVVEKCPIIPAAVWSRRPFVTFTTLEAAITEFIDALPRSGETET